MKFLKHEIIGNKREDSWVKLLGDLRNLGRLKKTQETQWIFRALRVSAEAEKRIEEICKVFPAESLSIEIPSSFDDAWGKRDLGSSSVDPKQIGLGTRSSLRRSRSNRRFRAAGAGASIPDTAQQPL